ARAVASALRTALGLGTRKASASSTRSVEAYDLYLRGTSLASMGGPAAQAQALELWQRAVALDPTFALAWSQIAWTTRALTLTGVARVLDVREAVREAAAKAVKLEPNNWPAHLAQSAVHHLERNWAEMERSLAMATECAPGAPWDANLNWAAFHIQVGDVTACNEYQREAVQLNPLSLVASALYQMWLHCAGCEDIAEKEYQRSVNLPGNRDMVEHVAVHRAWARGGDFTAEYRRYVDHQVISMPVLTDLLGKQHDAEIMVAALSQASAEPFYQDPARLMMLAWWLANFGEDDASLVIMRRVYIDMASIHMSWLWFPVFERVRRLPGFEEILVRSGLVGYWQSRQSWGEFYAPPWGV
ncbi:MAG: hypothetical protein ABI859_10260, partial [Pseudomonadota bacterium]